MNWVQGVHRKKPQRNHSSEFRAIDSTSSRLQDPRNRHCFSWKKLPGKNTWYEVSRTGTRMDPASIAVTDTPEQLTILDFSTQKALQYLMLKLHHCSDDNGVTGELPCPCTCVPGQTEEPGRRGADPKSYSLTFSDGCLILCCILSRKGMVWYPYVGRGMAIPSPLFWGWLYWFQRVQILGRREKTEYQSCLH